MSTYLVKRSLLMLLTLFGMSVVIFVLLRLVPGNIADILFDSAGFVDPAEKAAIERDLGLDLPWVQQYWHWISGLFTGDLGMSYATETPVWEELAPRLPITAKLAIMSLFFAVAFGVPLGVISAVNQNKTIDYVVRVISLSGLSLPSFWLAILSLMAVVHWFGTIPIYKSEFETWWDEFVFYLLPAITVGFRSSAILMRMTRSSMLEVLGQDFIRTARSKGAPERAVNYRHALPNALLPVTTLIGIEAAFLIGGLIVTETVFNIPGMARFMVEAIQWRDYPIVQNLVMIMALVVVVVNFLTDIIYVALDPRIKLAGR